MFIKTAFVRKEKKNTFHITQKQLYKKKVKVYNSFIFFMTALEQIRSGQ